MTSENTSSQTETQRVLGGPAAVAIVAGSMLGIGIFLVPHVVANNVGSSMAFLACWAVGALLAFAGATAYAELGVMFPEAGGDYVFIRKAFGASAGFATGVLLFGAIFTGSLATMAVALCQYQISTLATFVFGAAAAPLIEGQFLGLSSAQWAGIALVLALTVLNTRGTRLSAGVQIALTTTPILVLSAAAVYVLVSGPAQPLAAAAPVELETSARGIATALAAVYFAYAGWNAVAYVAGEVRNPNRNVPLGLLGGTGIVTIVYVLLCAGFLAVLGLAGLREAFEAGSAAAAVLDGPAAEVAVLVLITMALIGSINTTVLGGARIGYALARDGILPAWCSLIDSKSGTPNGALWLQAGIACLLILTGTFETLLEMTSVAMLLIAAMAVMALFVLRRRLPDLARPYRATGYPFVPAFFVLASAWIIVVTIWNALDPVSVAETTLLQRLLPVLGVVVFAGAYAVHRVATRTPIQIPVRSQWPTGRLVPVLAGESEAELDEPAAE